MSETQSHDDPELRHDERGHDEREEDPDPAAPEILGVDRYGPRPLV